MGFVVNPIGYVESSLLDRASAPKQGTGAPDAWLVTAPEYAEGLRDLQVSDEVVLLTWFDRADRTLRPPPGADPIQPACQVCAAPAARLGRRCATATMTAPTTAPAMAEPMVLVSHPRNPPSGPVASCTSTSRWCTNA